MTDQQQDVPQVVEEHFPALDLDATLKAAQKALTDGEAEIKRLRAVKSDAQRRINEEISRLKSYRRLVSLLAPRSRAPKSPAVKGGTGGK